MESYLLIGLFVVWVAVLAFFRLHRIWLPFYLLGSVGLAFIIVFLGRSAIPFEKLLKVSAAMNVHQLASLVGVETRLFTAVPGAIMVLVITQPIGWTVLQIGIESSGLLESAVLMGMVLFYPGWSLRKRLLLAGVGLLATYIANVVRISLIVASLHWVGKDFLFISHTILGRVVFFVLVIGIYWYIISLPTLRSLGSKLRKEANQ